MTEYKRIFLDTAPIIYLLEKADPYYGVIQNFFRDFPDTDYCSSVISRCEYLVFPYRNHDMDSVNRFEQFLDDFDISVNAIGNDIADQAARIRAQFLDDARDSAKILFISGKLQKGLCTASVKQGIQEFLVTVDQRIQFMRQRKDDMKVR